MRVKQGSSPNPQAVEIYFSLQSYVATFQPFATMRRTHVRQRA
jgi:hypothetical protein